LSRRGVCAARRVRAHDFFQRRAIKPRGDRHNLIGARRGSSARSAQELVMSRLTHIHRFAYLSLCLALAACVVKDKADPTSSATACSSGACDTSTTACETDGCGASTTSDPSSTTDACATDGCDTTYDTTFDMSDTAVDSEASTTEEAP